MFEQTRPRVGGPQRERTENDTLRDKLRVLQAENLQLHEMVAEQARTITAVQQLVGAPAPASINATIDVRIDGEAVTTPEGRKEIEAFVERLQRIGDGSGPIDR